MPHPRDFQKAEELAMKAVGALDPPCATPTARWNFSTRRLRATTIDFQDSFLDQDPDQKIFLKARSEAIKAIKRSL